MEVKVQGFNSKIELTGEICQEGSAWPLSSIISNIQQPKTNHINYHSSQPRRTGLLRVSHQPPQIGREPHNQHS